MSMLPQGWTECVISDIAQVVGGGTPPSKDESNFTSSGGIPWITPADLSGYRAAYISRGARNLTEKGYLACSAVKVPSGTVLFSSRAPIGYVAIAENEICTNQGFKSLALSGAVTSKYAYWYMKYVRPIAEQMATGTTFKELSGGAVARLPFILPPLEEQKRIADKLDAVLARVDSARAKLERVPVLLKRFRQAVLSAATSGALTDEWRRENGNPAWRYLRSTEACTKVQSGGTPKDGFSDGGVPFLKVYNIVDQRIEFNYKPQYVTTQLHRKELAKSVTQPGDVLMNIVGPPLGKVAIVPDTYPEWNINQAIALFRPGQEIISEWLYYILRSGKNISEILHETKGMVGQVNISLTQCREFIFPVPIVEEQREITRRIESLFVIADKIQVQYEQASERLTKLTPALLAKAFRGELVPQDPDDEPAEILLERVKELASTVTKKRGRRAIKA